MTKSKLITIALMALLCMSMVFAADSGIVGNLGVGTLTPNTLLDLESSDPQLRLFDTDGLAAFILKAEGSVGSITTDSSSDRNFYFDNNGTADLFVGFGTSTPSTELELQDGTFTIDQSTNNLGVNIDSEATTATNYGIKVLTDQGAYAAWIGTSNSDYYTKKTATSGDGSNYFERNIDSGTTSGAIVGIRNLNAADDQPSLKITNAANSDALYIDTENTGTSNFGLEIDLPSSISMYGIDVRTDDGLVRTSLANGGGSQVGRFDRNLGSASTSTEVFSVSNLNSGDDQDVITTQNEGSGRSIFIDHNSLASGKAFEIDTENANDYGFFLNQDGGKSQVSLGYTASGTGSNDFYRNADSAATAAPVFSIRQDHVSDDQDALNIDQDGSGRPLYITKSADDFNRIEFRDTSQGSLTNYVGFTEGNNAYRRTFHAYRNLGSSNTGLAVATITQASSSDDTASLSVTNAGSGLGVEVESAAVGIEISSTDSPLNKYREFTVGEDVVNGDVVYFKSDGKMWETDADAEATSIGLLGIATETCNADATCTIMLEGGYTTTGLTTGSLYYLSTIKAGYTTTAPSTAGQIVRPIGQALSTTELYINPDWAWAEN